MSDRRMTLAVPNKGRLVEPTLHLLHDAGLVFEERDRSRWRFDEAFAAVLAATPTLVAEFVQCVS